MVIAEWWTCFKWRQTKLLLSRLIGETFSAKLIMIIWYLLKKYDLTKNITPKNPSVCVCVGGGWCTPNPQTLRYSWFTQQHELCVFSHGFEYLVFVEHQCGPSHGESNAAWSCAILSGKKAAGAEFLSEGGPVCYVFFFNKTDKN